MRLLSTPAGAQDGIAIAHALGEHLLALGAFTLFATHFAELLRLEALYPNCRAMQLGCSQDGGSSWKLHAFSQQQSHYGLLLAPQVHMQIRQYLQHASMVGLLMCRWCPAGWHTGQHRRRGHRHCAEIGAGVVQATLVCALQQSGACRCMH